MPGICGAVTTTPSDLSLLLGEMVVRMRHYPWYLEQLYVGRTENVALGRVTLGFGNTATQPVSNEDSTFLAVMEGEIHNYDEERRSLVAAGHNFHSESYAELLLHGYEQEGRAFFRRLHGFFVTALWDKRQQRLLLVNDRFGMKPLYYSKLPRMFLLASEIKALFAEPSLARQINMCGLAQFFTFGQLLGEDTLFQAVHLLPAGGCLTYDAREDLVSVDRYWHYEPNSVTKGFTETEWLEQIDEAFVRAVNRRTGGTKQLGLSLSGGLDARTILGVVDSEQPLTSVTMGVAGSIDHCSAGELARLAKRPHHRYVLDTQFLTNFAEHLQWMVHLTDGQYLSQCIVMPTLPFYRELGIEVLLRGHAGELMHMDKAYNFSLDGDALELNDGAALEHWCSRRLCTHMLDDTQEPLFAGEFHHRIEELARDSLHHCLRESEGVDPPVQRIAHLFLTQRVRRETALSMVKFGSLVETRLPYLDHDLIDLLLAAPPKMKLGDRIQGYILGRHQPAFLQVVNANTGTPLGAGQLTRWLARLRCKVLAKLGVPGYQPYERLGLWLRRELRPLVEKMLLGDRCLGRGILNPKGVRAVVDGHLNRGRNHTFLLLALMVFEQSQREFMDGDAYSTCSPHETLLAQRGG